MENVPDVLLKIVETKKKELLALPPTDELRKAALEAAPALNFAEAFRKGKRSVITEIKKASPSAGIIAEDFDPAATAKAYAAAGVDAVSILTDTDYFKGSPQYIPDCRPILKNIPILRKDFIIAPEQIYEARALGADSFLLIAAILEKDQLARYLDIGRELGMEALVESHTEEELEKSISAGSRIFGINSRNLHDFSVDLAVAEKLLKLIPQEAISVAESGIRSKADAERVFTAGFDAILVGEYLMRGGPENVGGILREIRGV